MAHSLPPNPMTYRDSSPRERSPIPPPREHADQSRDEPPRAGFSRSGFAPIPHRHSDYPSQDRMRDDYERPPLRDREREFPRRELDPEPEYERWERRMDAERWPDRRRDWDDDYDRPKRRRSPSPLGPSSRQRILSPSPPSRGPQLSLPDPAELENLLTFRQFAEWFRASHPQTAKADEEELRRVREALESGASEGLGKERVGMGKRYERYRREYSSRQLYALYLSHRASPWFQERYSHLPEYATQRRRVNRQGRITSVEKYLDNLRTGFYDSISYDMTDSAEQGPSAGMMRRQSDHEEPEGLDKALEDVGKYGDDPLRTEVAPKDNQVFIKTVPPSTSRLDLEGLFSSTEGFRYLALTEPSTKKAFHRVAWAQFADNVEVEEIVKKLDGSKVDNFTFHMGVNTAPVVGRIRITQPVANTLARLQKDAAMSKALAIRLEEELLGDEEEAKPELSAEVKVEGDQAKPTEAKLQSLPGLREKGSDVVEERIGRMLENAGIDGDVDEEQRIKKVKVVLDHWVSYLRNGLFTCYYCVAPMSFSEELHRKCISHMRPHPSAPEEAPLDTVHESNTEMDGDKPGIEVKEEEDVKRDDEDGDVREHEEAKPEKKEDAQRRTIFPTKNPDERWEEQLDFKLRPLLGEVDVVEYLGRDVEEETRKLCAPSIKQEEASKYRCKECTKLFKAPEFVLKHIIIKHGEVIKQKLDEIADFNNFALDPQHLQTTALTPATVNDRLPLPIQPSLPLPVINPFIPTPNFNPMLNTNMTDQPREHRHKDRSNRNNDAAYNNGQPGMNVMQQQMMMMMQMQQAMMMGMQSFPQSGQSAPMGTQGQELAGRMGGFSQDSGSQAPLPLPLPAGGEDPRARRGRVSYKDLDEPSAGGDGGLPY